MSEIASKTTGLPAIFADVLTESWSFRMPREPFVQEGYVWATDGRVCVRVAAPAEVPPSWNNPQAPAAAKVWGQWVQDGEAVPLPEFVPGESPCGRCGGAGHVECNLEYEHECPDCDGSGEVVDRSPVRVGDHSFGRHYLALLWRHGVREVRMAAATADRGKGVAFVARFTTADGVEGILVPANAPE